MTEDCHLKIHAWWRSTNIQRKKWVRYKLKYTSKILGTGSPIYLFIYLSFFFFFFFSPIYLVAEVKIVSLDKFRKLAQVIKCD